MTKIIALMAAFAAMPAFADLPNPNDVYFLNGISVNGSGCKYDDTEMTLNEDRTSLSILFSNFIALAGGKNENGINRPAVDRKSCNIAVPVHVPQGYSVSVFQIDYRG